MGDSDTLFANPKHPYTEALLSAIPDPDPDIVREQIILQGDPQPANPLRAAISIPAPAMPRSAAAGRFQSFWMWMARGISQRVTTPKNWI